jgi:hypothetical protein
MTSSEDERDVLTAYDRHVNAYIKKPMDLTKFLEAVAAVENFWLEVVRLPDRAPTAV